MQEAFPGKPRKIQQISRVEMTRDQVYYYNKICNEVIADIHAGTVTAPEIQQKLIKLLQVCQGYVRDDAGKEVEFNGNKIKELRDMLVGGDLSDRKVIVWCRFKRDLRQVSKMLTRSRVQHMVLHGDLNDKERDVVKEVWNIDPRYRVLVGMLQMGIGINLHAPNCVVHRGGVAVPYRCSTSVFLGVDWRVTQLEQAMDRVYRGDQVETCLYRYLLCEDTEGLASISGQDQPIDFRVYSVLLEKLEQGTRISEESIDYIRRLL
jgi:SNF2 family DNA or RNA helicase